MLTLVKIQEKTNKRSLPKFDVPFAGILEGDETEQEKIYLVSCKISLLLHFKTTCRLQNFLTQAACGLQNRV